MHSSLVSALSVTAGRRPRASLKERLYGSPAGQEDRYVAQVGNARRRGLMAAAAPVAYAPVATAEPVWPVAGAEVGQRDHRRPASPGIRRPDQLGERYPARFRLYRCKVTAIHNPNHSPPSENTFATVYVDVSCPNPDDDWAGAASASESVSDRDSDSGQREDRPDASSRVREPIDTSCGIRGE